MRLRGVLRGSKDVLKKLYILALFLSFFARPQEVSAGEISVNNELYVEISEMIVPVVQRRDVAGFFSITVAIDCKTLEMAKKVRKYLPIIRDRFFWDMYVLLGVIWSPDFRTDITAMKKRLMRRVVSIMGEDDINDVLVLSFQQHQRRNVDFS